MAEQISISSWIIPVVMAAVFLHGLINNVRVFEAFTRGAQEGLQLAVKLVPYLLGIYVAVSIFRESGAVDLMVQVLNPVIRLLEIPAEALFLSVVRTLSGPAALSMMIEIFDTHGPDSYMGRLASTLMGSTDTTFYIIAIYFGSVGIKKTRYAIPVGIIADFAGLLASAHIAKLLFK
ncbi:spore maturation protein B [Caldanaerovirga acetigignens]|uniref:Spore maturation protein B n=1 Tax=Caldanaerovirga acetigignens TaxID=447595 RepID=A0A1M7FKU7_9FIRM|nr:nucleoside recognition domain-containing protein [Caldanaerovirga acetigignens]SHM04691.1 spore maturation protein B [Caldanaerovirga acetigignens]